jgi:hypothetical protein
MKDAYKSDAAFKILGKDLITIWATFRSVILLKRNDIQSSFITFTFTAVVSVPPPPPPPHTHTTYDSFLYLPHHRNSGKLKDLFTAMGEMINCSTVSWIKSEGTRFQNHKV